jgi:two-component system nitrogen regulation sensor histidine kinase NtrY
VDFFMTVETTEASPNLIRQLGSWASSVGLARKLAFALFVAGVAAGIATYVALTGSPPFGRDPRTVRILLVVDLVLLLLLAIVVAHRIVAVWAARRRGSAGSRLHVRLVLLFSLVAATPAVVVAVFSALFFEMGLEAWFSDRVRTALQESVAVAEAYLEEHQKNIRADVLAMAIDVDREAPTLLGNPARFAQILTAQAALRSLSEAVVFDEMGRVWARAGFSFALEFEPVPAWALEKARDKEVAILTSEGDDRVRALVRLNRVAGSFLYVGRLVDHRVLGHMERTLRAVRAYEKLEGERSGLQITFAMIFMMVALLLLLAAVWLGLTLATQLARPISGLIAAAERVRAGDLTARVEEGPSGDELGSLSRAFNRMTNQLDSQRSELVEANRQLDLRRRFTEAVLSGVSAGVIGLDHEGRINLPNRSASVLLLIDFDRLVGREMAEVVPEMAGLVNKARRRPDRLVESQINLTAGGRVRTLLVRIAAERVGQEVKGFVVTFDDVTELLSAQRKAAWADVARRIAHEIKNPLTPIQLSAERLKRKYLRQIKIDPDTFTTCTDTIVRQVNDIGRMVDEFSSFARMPAPVMAEEDLCEMARQAVFLQRNAHPEIAFDCDLPEEPVPVACDGQQIGQALTNLLQNAVESVATRNKPKDGELLPGRVQVRVAPQGEHTVVDIEDNGRGFPAEHRHRLTEPYVTTRVKGTGLGLAIAKKIMEDHGGDLILGDRDGGGARVSLVFGRGPGEAGALSGAADAERESPVTAHTSKASAHGT